MYDNFCELGKKLLELKTSFKKQNQELEEVIMHPDTLEKLKLEIEEMHPQFKNRKIYGFDFGGIKITTSTFCPKNIIIPRNLLTPKDEYKPSSELLRTAPITMGFEVRDYRG